jgi:hypothetical protein
VIRWATVALLTVLLAARADNTGTDLAHKYAWGENIGWANGGPTNNGITTHFDGDTGWLSGQVWGENVGWIVMGSAGRGPYENTSTNNWGVNLAANGDLSGYAWGENIGWINFGHALCDATVNPANGEFFGHAWGENIGWITFKGTTPNYGVRTLAYDTQAQGTPNWWLDYHGVTESYDAGDGVAAWRKYVMDTDPNVAGDYLFLTALSNAPAANVVTFTPASTRRYYTLRRCEDLAAGGWSNVAGQVSVVGVGGAQTMQDTNTAAWVFYRIRVTLTP